MAWTAVFFVLLFVILKLLRLLKVSQEEELRGIDLFQHGEPAYALRIYCAACGEQLQGKTVEQETVGVRTNYPNIVTDAEGGTSIWFAKNEIKSNSFSFSRSYLFEKKLVHSFSPMPLVTLNVYCICISAYVLDDMRR